MSSAKQRVTGIAAGLEVWLLLMQNLELLERKSPAKFAEQAEALAQRLG